MRHALVLMGLLAAMPGTVAAQGWKSGAAKVPITPTEPMWMAGYGARNHESEGVEHDLWTKALVLEDAHGKRVVLVTLDICGIDRALSLQVRERLREKYKLGLDAVALSCSHTHSGPVVGTNLITMYPLNEEQHKRVERYASNLSDAIVAVVGKAIDALRPADLDYGLGRCATFAFNRRNNDQSRVPELREQGLLAGPDDHDVPVLRVQQRGTNAQRAVVFGLACHCTTLDYYKFCGDYAGFAQQMIEEKHPDTIALYWAGCGADQNPLPRGTVELARRWGQDLADAVNDVVVGTPMHTVRGDSLTTSYREIDLEFAPLPPNEKWEELAKSDNRFEAERARYLLKRIEKDGNLKPSYPYPIEMWKLGDSLTWVFLGGEVVVDYAHRIKRNLGSDRTWVTAYTNDVMAYIPTLRVLKEGGYEGGGAMLYYAQPGPWSERVEEQICTTVADMARALKASASNSGSAAFHAK